MVYDLWVRFVLAAIFVLSVAFGCSLFLDYSGIDDGHAGGVVKGCAWNGGPKPVLMTLQDPDAAATAPLHVCIDTTEVTQAQYQNFLDWINAGNKPQSPPPSPGVDTCISKIGYTPTSGTLCPGGSFDPVGHANYPVTCVDFCDAYSFCKWSGKRLCGRLGTGEDYDDRIFQLEGTVSEWDAICTGNHQWLYAWGDSKPDDSRCNTPRRYADPDAGAIAMCGTDQTCVTPDVITGTASVYDLGGNVKEWSNSCGGTTGMRFCQTMGESFADGDGQQAGACVIQYNAASTQTSIDLGFRCCSTGE